MTWHHFHHFLSKVFHNFILIENKNWNKLGQCACQLGKREGRKAAYRKVSQHPLNPLRQLIFCVNFTELRDAQITGKILLLGVSAAAAAKSLQSCPTLCNPIDGSPPDSPVPGILQARTLEWAAISFSNAWKWKVKVKSLSRVWPSATPWTAAHQAPRSMGFSRQEYWSGVPSP